MAYKMCRQPALTVTLAVIILLAPTEAFLFQGTHHADEGLSDVRIKDMSCSVSLASLDCSRDGVSHSVPDLVEV